MFIIYDLAPLYFIKITNGWGTFDFYLPLRSKKAGRFPKLLGFRLWHVAQWVSCAPPNHTLPAYLDLGASLCPGKRFSNAFQKVFMLSFNNPKVFRELYLKLKAK